MIQITNLEAFNIEGAIRGMRNPFKNTHLSDSIFRVDRDCFDEQIRREFKSLTKWGDKEGFEEHFQKGIIWKDGISFYNLIGPKDLDLAQRLIKGSSPHDKFMRQIFVSMDIRTSLYHWKQIDQYRVGATTDSESTMHTITKAPFSIQDFSWDGSFYHSNDLTLQMGMTLLQQDIFVLNKLRDYWLEEKDPERKAAIWRTIIQKLPDSYLQKRTWSGNYAMIRNMIQQRKGHKVYEWEGFEEKMHELPWADELIFI